MAQGVAWSLDLRIRAVEAYNNGEGTLSEVAERFNIGRRTLSLLLLRERETGTVEPSKNRGRPPRRVDDAGRDRIRSLVQARPDATLDELTDAYNSGATPESRISRQTLGREVRRLDLTQKKDPDCVGEG
ncbi:MAG: helix-turn-helix domain-containing protein [Candidatus Sericytochromatia bacterium]|nr:helix-turn-helix domain-containing protein [Candidatus Tanganyikabacteria bacterium]